MKQKKDRRNTMKFGFIIGIATPFIVFSIIYLAMQPDVSLPNFIIGMWRMNALLGLFSLSIVPNLLFFTIFNKLKYDFSMRGILMATVFYCLLFIISRAFV